MAGPKTIISGRTAVITGAGSGIGRAMAQRLSRHGSPVAIADINPDALDETASSLSGPVLATVLDVGDRQAQMSFGAEVDKWAPAPLGMVFNNAGVALSASVAAGSVEDEEWLRKINYEGVVHGVHAFLPILLRQDSGVIVNTSSVFGLAGIPFQSAYCAAKFAVRGFTESLRHELRGTGVRAITVHPGGVRTNIVNNGRMRQDPADLGRPVDEVAREFERLARTSPDKAAKIIHQGIEKGKARILVGPDAYVFDFLTRAAPTHYYDVLALVERGLRSRVVQRRVDRP
ncbi:MAG TPA: SDR family NAD(P)-dependent oxidoreductase [Thermoleophilaceae bacterium]